MSDVYIVKAKKASLRTPLASDGATIYVNEFVDHKDNALALSDFGAWFVVVLKQGSNIEVIKCDGITQNADGTADLSIATNGRHLNATTPYAGGATGLDFQTAEVIVTNDPYTVSQFASKINAETVSGVWTFDKDTGRPKLSADADTAVDEEFVSFGQLARQAIAGAADASTTVAGLVEEATTAEALAGTAAGSEARLFITPETLQAVLQGQASIYVVEDGVGADDAYTGTATPTLSAYTTGQVFRIKFTVANTAAATLDIDSVGAKAIKKYVSGAKADIETGDIVANYVGLLEYDGTDFVLISMTATTPTTALLSEMATFFGAFSGTGADVEALTDGSDATGSHFHSPPFFKVNDKGNGGNGLLLGAIAGSSQMCLSPDGSKLFVTHKFNNNEVTVDLYTRDTLTGLFYYTNTATSTGSAFSTNQVAGICAGDTYVWIVARNAAGSDIRILRLPHDLSAQQAMTISGTALTDHRQVAGDDTTLYISGTSTSTNVAVYSISGTTATRGADITIAVQGQYRDGFYFDGTDLLFVDSNDSWKVKRYNVSGTLQSTGIQVPNGTDTFPGGATTDHLEVRPVGMGHMKSGAIYVLSSVAYDTDGSAGNPDRSFIEGYGITKP